MWDHICGALLQHLSQHNFTVDHHDHSLAYRIPDSGANDDQTEQTE